MAEANQQNEINAEQQADETESHPGGLASNRGGLGPKTEWPEVVGFTPEEAERKIKADMAIVQFQVVPPNNFVTMDYNQRRVRLFLDANGKVARPPRIG